MGHKRDALSRNESGFSMIELLIYLALLGILMAMVFSSFTPVMQTSSRQWRLAETKIESGLGLDLLRADLEHAGFGLPWEFPPGGTPIPYSEPAILADAPNVPRAVLSEDLSASSMNSSDYLAIKGLNVVLGETSQKWGWLGRDAAHATDVQSLSDDAFVSTDRVIVIRPQVSPGEERRLVLLDVPTAEGTNYFAPPTAAFLTPFAPPETPHDPDGERHLIYGLNNDNGISRPFNRTDYYINNASVPQQCAPGTGTLAKATLNQANNSFIPLPIMDCVADFQVVYYLDTDGDGGWDARANAGGLTGMTAQQIRDQVKSIRCYILTHEGGVDREYTHPLDPVTGLPTINVGEVAADGITLQLTGDRNAPTAPPAGRAFDLSTLPPPPPGIVTTWRNYRWKVYSIAVTPKNLQ
ncbi:MAG: prepilin-type N-terminal cleavage/methylation domain-containing protein [Desulfurivibrionaceae bacterium]